MEKINSVSDNSTVAVPKKPYEKPAFRCEQVFVTSALSCTKAGTLAQCSTPTKAS
jgi:hypothetical protein